MSEFSRGWKEPSRSEPERDSELERQRVFELEREREGKIESKPEPAVDRRNYQLSKIYAITNNVNNMKYIGEAIENSLEEELIYFKEQIDYDTGGYFRLIEDIRTMGKDNFTIELLEAFPCSTYQELQTRLKEWIDKLGTNEFKRGYN